MFSKISDFFRTYKHFGIVLIAIVISLILDLTGQDKIAHLILAATALGSTLPLLAGMYRDLQDGKYGIDILAATAIITSVVLHEYWTAIIIVFMLTGGESLEDYAEHRARRELDSLLENAPQKAHILRGRKTIEVNIKDVKVNDKVLVRPGEVVPVDGVIIDGQTSLDESSLTGESLPVYKKLNDEILSGAVNIDGGITIRVLRKAEDSQYEQIIKLVKSAASTESPFVRLTDRYAVPFTIISFAIAGLAWYVGKSPERFLQVIVVATPCPLLLAAPIALISGMSRAAKNGIIIKTGSALEKLASVKTVGFDKTGTLTHGTPVLSKITTYNGFSQNDVLAYAAAAEQKSVHVLAKAIVNAATDKKLKLPKIKQLKESAGYCLSAQVGPKTVLIGKLDFLRDNKIEIPKSFDIKKFDSTLTCLAVDNKLAGVISFTDEVRPESKSMLTKLKQLGIKNILMVTGDNQIAASKIAKKLGISEVVSQALPADKVMAIKAANPKPIAFVGDGVNDAPVLTAADIGIALGARGSTAASESADVVIMLDDVAHVSQALEIAKRTFSIAKQAILIGIGLSIILQLIFFTGRFRPVYGAAIQELVDVAVIFIALRAHGPFRKPKAE